MDHVGNPFALAFLANKPAAITLRGLLVLVQLVIAAIIHAPSGIKPSSFSTTPEIPCAAKSLVDTRRCGFEGPAMLRPTLDKLFQFEPGFDFGTPKQVLDETLIMEKLAKNPHRNIIHYRGCRVKRGRITGIVIDKYEMSLEQFIKSAEVKNLDIDAFLSDISSAVDHLHSLGLAHNDINPGNIMMGEKNQPVLIDFGSCQPFGRLLQTFGTPGWFEEDFWTSEKKHDDIALEKLRQWLKIVKPVEMIKSEL